MNIYLFAKKLHRYLVSAIIFLTLVMSATGGMLKFPVFFGQFGFLDLGLARYVHGQMSLLFGITLFLMAMSGLVMYIFPVINARRQKKNKIQAEQEKKSHI